MGFSHFVMTGVGVGTITLIPTDKETEASEVTLCVHHLRKRGVSFLRGLPLVWPASLSCHLGNTASDPQTEPTQEGGIWKKCTLTD